MCIGICENCIYVVLRVQCELDGEIVRTVVMPYALERILCVLVLLGTAQYTETYKPHSLQ